MNKDNICKTIENVLELQSSHQINLKSYASRKTISEQIYKELSGKFYFVPYGQTKETSN